MPVASVYATAGCGERELNFLVVELGRLEYGLSIKNNRPITPAPSNVLARLLNRLYPFVVIGESTYAGVRRTLTQQRYLDARLWHWPSRGRSGILWRFTHTRCGRIS